MATEGVGAPLFFKCFGPNLETCPPIKLATHKFCRLSKANPHGSSNAELLSVTAGAGIPEVFNDSSRT